MPPCRELPRWACLPGVFSFDASAGLPRSVVGPRLRQFHPWSGARDSPRVPDNPARADNHPPKHTCGAVTSSARYSPRRPCGSLRFDSVHLHAIKENQKTDRPTGYSPFYTPDPSVWHERIQVFAKPHTRDFSSLGGRHSGRFLFEFLRTPIPWMIGPMVGVASLNLMGDSHSVRFDLRRISTGGRRVPAGLAAEHSYSRDLAGYRAKFQKNFTFITAPFWCRSFSVLRWPFGRP